MASPVQIRDKVGAFAYHLDGNLEPWALDLGTLTLRYREREEDSLSNEDQAASIPPRPAALLRPLRFGFTS